VLPWVLLALLAAGGFAGRALASHLPAPLWGLALALLGLRVGVMAAAVEEPPAGPPRPAAPGAGVREPAPRTAGGRVPLRAPAGLGVAKT
jgi:hypothetical protein